MAKAKSIADGLMIQIGYDPKGYCGAEHDIFYGCLDSDVKMLEKDKKKLEDLGWFIDEECDCWAIFT